MTDAVVRSDDGALNGLILLVGPPASGKSSFLRAWIERGRLDRDGVVSCDSIRNELAGDRVDVSDDPVVFDTMDRRIEARLKAALPVVVDATNVMPHARTRMIAWARRYGRPVTALRFRVATEILVRRNAERLSDARVPLDDVLRFAAVAALHTNRAQLFGEGITVVVDVPGEAEGLSPAQAAEMIRLTAWVRPVAVSEWGGTSAHAAPGVLVFITAAADGEVWLPSLLPCPCAVASDHLGV